MGKNVRILAVCLLLVGIVLAVGCSKKAQQSSGEAAPEYSGTLVVGITEASGNFNPLYYSSAYDGFVVNLVFEGLIAMNFDGEYEMGEGAAESWAYSNDNKTITFKMKQNLVFSDGTPVTADDVVFTYQVLADPSYTGRYGSAVVDMKGYDDYFNGKTTTFEGVVAIDDHTVQFNFAEALRVNFENCGYAIMPRHYYGAGFKVGDTAAIEAITGSPIGSGPYLVEKFQEKEFVSLTRNPNYAGEGYEIKDIIMKFVDETTDIVELTTGNVDLLTGMIEPAKIAEAKAAGKMLNSYPRSGYGYIKTNHESGPTSELKVRQALYYSFNIKEFVNSYFKDEATGQVLAGTQAHPFSQVSWVMSDKLVKSLDNYDFDLEKAKKLLDEAGWKLNAAGKREKNGQLLELKIAAMPDHAILSTLIPMWERDWGQGLGVSLNIAYLEFNTILDYIIYDSDANVNEWSLFFLATSIPSPDPHSVYTEFHSSYIGSGQDNTSRYRNAKVDQLLDEGKRIMDPEKAKPLYEQVVKILNEEAVMMPVYANTYFDLYDGKLTNFKTSSLYSWTSAMKDARIK
ncbi:MAG: ABC transporter substrate-binding protein [Clostridia bacterium]